MIPAILAVASVVFAGVGDADRTSAGTPPINSPASELAAPAPAVPRPVAVTAPTRKIEPKANPAPALPASADEALAYELESLWTRDAYRLVQTLDSASHRNPLAPPLTFLLSIAYAETNGMVLDISEAGAVGLAQATPIAFLTEGYSGNLYITKDYVDGSVDYFLKKPLGDADTIASIVLDDSSASALVYARQLLASAYKVRREGVDDLDVLTPFAPAGYTDTIASLDAKNVATLDELGRLLDSGDRAALKTFRDRAHDQYRSMLMAQRASWREYQLDLVDARTAALRKAFPKTDPAAVIRTNAYEAGEMLARTLDSRFSPTLMAAFLTDHLSTKVDEAHALGVNDSELTTVASALYNGGSQNVLRMRAGLISYLPETENYMRKVPAMKARLDAVAATYVASNAPASSTASKATTR